MPQIVPPVPLGEAFESDVVSQFLEFLRKQANQPVFYSQTTDPGTAGVPSGSWSIWKNTTSGQVRLWANDGGVMKSVQLV
jgi:hypothetical protein